MQRHSAKLYLEFLPKIDLNHYIRRYHEDDFINQGKRNIIIDIIIILGNLQL